ncbi:MAG: hypothetical protein AAFR95_15350, partial [Bacteroidota bacterium]
MTTQSSTVPAFSALCSLSRMTFDVSLIAGIVPQSSHSETEAVLKTWPFFSPIHFFRHLFVSRNVMFTS